MTPPLRPLAQSPEEKGPRSLRLNTEGLPGTLPFASWSYFKSRGVGNPIAVSYDKLPDNVKAELAEVQPAVERLGKDFNYERLASIAEQNREKLSPAGYSKLASVAALGLGRQLASRGKAAKEAVLLTGHEFSRQVTLGLMPKIPEDQLQDLDLSPQGVAIARAVGGVAGIAVAGKLIISALSKATLLPKIGPVIEQLPQRVKEVMIGVGTGAVLDAARPDGLPEDPAAIDISARLAHPIADILGDSEAAKRVALGLSGGIVGGAIGELFAPIFRGIRNAREIHFLDKQVKNSPETLALIRKSLVESGIDVVEGETSRATVAKLLRNTDKVSQSARMAAMTAADETRMDFILNQLYSDPAFKGSADVRHIAGVFRANPGGLSVVKGVTDVTASEELVKRMGLNVVSIKAGGDLIIMRPQVVFPTRPAMGARMKNQLDDFVTQVRALNRGKPSTRMSILSDGSIVRGEYNASEMASRFKLKAPIVEGSAQSDVALREHFGLMDVQVAEGGVVRVTLPETVTQRQASTLASMADRGIPQITLNGATPGVSITLDQPFGMQVEDALANLVRGATKPKITADVVKKVQQYQREGVFAGQAGVLPDGYPVEVMRKIGKKIAYKDPITGLIHRIPEENLTILPTSLEGELLPSRQIFEALGEGEQKAFAALRRGINEGLVNPITTIRELEGFANTRGKFVSPMGKGKVRVYDAVTGESKVYDSIRSATVGLRGTLGPLPDLTPPEIEELLGFKPNIGTIGGGGPPAKFGEYIPISEEEFANAANMETTGLLPPGAIEQFFTPMRGFSEDMSKTYNMPFDKVFSNLQSATVHRQNFVAAWAHGKGPGLPKGVMPLNKIWKLAGKPGDGRQELITDWLEAASDDIARVKIERMLKPNEIRAAQELRKWYGLSKEDGLFRTLGIEAEWLTDYAPHIREHAEAFGNNLQAGWRLSRGTPLPKSVEYFADYVRDGTLSLYDKRAFVVATEYLGAGARTRFMNQAMEDAKRLIRAIPDNAVKGPLVNYIEALRGWEFTPQRAALDASFSSMLRSLGASEKVAKDVGEKLSLGLLGMSYQATMAFRPGLAVRNAAQIFQTTWPLLGNMGDDVFAAGLGRALTKIGRDEAIRAGAISVKQNAVFLQEESFAVLPSGLSKMSEYGFKLYDTADMFTRSVTFQVAKLRSERAIATYGKSLTAGKNTEAATRALVKESGAMVLSPRFRDEYLRRVATSPESAGDFIGKQMSDITQFLYGRGNQMRWMRSIPGRFLGQFGTWPLWYIDFVRRSTLNMWKNGYQREALQFLGKIAIVDMAIYESGRRANLDLRRWMSVNAIFGTPPISQPPAVNLLYGVAQMSRGLSEAVFGTYDSPANKQRLATARRTLAQAGYAFIPNMYAIRDIGRLMNASTPTEALAAALSTRPSTEYTVQQRLDMLFNPAQMSTDIELEDMGDTTPTATKLLLDGMQAKPQKLIVPQGNLPTQPPGATPMPGATGGGNRSSFRVRGPASGLVEPTALPESIRTGESKPVQ